MSSYEIARNVAMQNIETMSQYQFAQAVNMINNIPIPDYQMLKNDMNTLPWSQYIKTPFYYRTRNTLMGGATGKDTVRDLGIEVCGGIANSQISQSTIDDTLPAILSALGLDGCTKADGSVLKGGCSLSQSGVNNLKCTTGEFGDSANSNCNSAGEPSSTCQDAQTMIGAPLFNCTVAVSQPYCEDGANGCTPLPPQPVCTALPPPGFAKLPGVNYCSAETPDAGCNSSYLPGYNVLPCATLDTVTKDFLTATNQVYCSVKQTSNNSSVNITVDQDLVVNLDESAVCGSLNVTQTSDIKVISQADLSASDSQYSIDTQNKVMNSALDVLDEYVQQGCKDRLNIGSVSQLEAKISAAKTKLLDNDFKLTQNNVYNSNIVDLAVDQNLVINLKGVVYGECKVTQESYVDTFTKTFLSSVTESYFQDETFTDLRDSFTAIRTKAVSEDVVDSYRGFDPFSEENSSKTYIAIGIFVFLTLLMIGAIVYNLFFR